MPVRTTKCFTIACLGPSCEQYDRSIGVSEAGSGRQSTVADMSADPLAPPSATGSDARNRRPSRRWWTGGSGVPALLLWALSRVSVLVFVLAASQLTASGRPPGFLGLWNRWDVSRLIFVA